MDWVLNNAAMILLILAAVLIGFGALLGIFRGFKRAFIRFLTVVAAFFGSLFVCRFFLTNTEKVLNNARLNAIIERFNVTILDQLKAELPEVYSVLIGLPVAILSPIIFTVLFIVASFFFELISMIIGFFAGPKRGGKLVGMLIGAAQGAIVTVALMIPLCGLLTNAVSAIETIEAEQDEGYTVEAVEQLSAYKEQMTGVTDSPLYKLVDKYAGKPVCDSLMRYSVDGKDIDVKKETDNVARIYAHSFPLIKTQNIKEPTVICGRVDLMCQTSPQAQVTVASPYFG